MRPIWSGSISFGLVNIPVNLYSATGEERISFHLLHKRDLSPINYARVCREDGEEIPWEDVVKGYEYKKGDYVVLTKGDFDKANLKKTSTVDIKGFSRAEEIDPKYYSEPYFLEPTPGAEKPYAILREALSKSGMVGIGTFVMRNKEKLIAVRADGKLLMLLELRHESDFKSPRGIKLPGKATGKEIGLAVKLIDELKGRFAPEKFKDEYHKDLLAIIHKKAVGKTLKTKGSRPRPTKSKDVMKKLKASLRRGTSRI